jgi:hypothetical protein
MAALFNRRAMDTVSLVSAFAGAESGMMQLAVAARLERMNAQNGAAVAKLVDAAQQSADALANAADGTGTRLDVSA